MFTFFTNDPCDLDLLPSEFKINRGHVLIKPNQHVKYDSSIINGSQETRQKLFLQKGGL